MQDVAASFLEINRPVCRFDLRSTSVYLSGKLWPNNRVDIPRPLATSHNPGRVVTDSVQLEGQESTAMELEKPSTKQWHIGSLNNKARDIKIVESRLNCLRSWLFDVFVVVVLATAAETPVLKC